MRGQLPTGKGNFISAAYISICLLADRTCAFEAARAMMIAIGNRPCAFADRGMELTGLNCNGNRS
ncbi:hypothetical protein [Streptomyces acidicola]|uniref:hypothetical protein n=1 Tax=Streptomyces acidicola TaxID=2596892 RepID=UPI00381079AF